MDKILAPIKQRITNVLDYKGINKSKFFNKINVSASNFRSKSLYSEVGGDVIAKILAELPDVNPSWLLTGEGSMLRGDDAMVLEPAQGGIPLIHATSFGTYPIDSEDVQAHYYIPDFIHVDFLIRVAGLNMQPLYSPGDIVACRILQNHTVLQWGRVFALNHAEQGLILARLFPHTDDTMHECRSDNKEYPPFPIPKSSITLYTLIVGSIHLK